MALVALIFLWWQTLILRPSKQSEELIEDLMTSIESASDEAALKNSNVRFQFELSNPENDPDERASP